MSRFTTLKRFDPEDNTGSRFGNVFYRTISQDGKDCVFELLQGQYIKQDDIERAKKYLQFWLGAKRFEIIDEIPENEANTAGDEEESGKTWDGRPLMEKTIYDALKDGTLKDLDDERNLGLGYTY